MSERVKVNNQQRRNLIILSIILVVAMLGYGMVIPIFPFYIESMGASGDDLGLLIAVGAFTELVFGPIWGSVSDRRGRKPVLMVGMFGVALSLVLMGLAASFYALLAARAFSGVLSAALSSTALAYISDSSSEKDRGAGIGILGGAAELGIIIGPALGGLLGSASLSMPFMISAVFSFVTVFLIWFFLPESLPLEERRHGKIAPGQGLKTFRSTLTRAIGPLLFLLLFLSLGLANFEAVFGLYALKKFDYGPEQVGLILTVIGIVTVIGKLLLTGPATRRWGDEAVAKASALAGAVGYGVLLTANTFPTILLATGFFILTKTMLRPAMFALISKKTGMGQGRSMGLSNSFTSMGRIGGALWAGWIFDINVNYPYLSGAGLMLVGFFISLAIMGKRRKSQELPDL
jgi:DHA1 family multidrug resistance protein-like MFS transporter